jgi:hypothetical protein
MIAINETIIDELRGRGDSGKNGDLRSRSRRQAANCPLGHTANPFKAPPHSAQDLVSTIQDELQHIVLACSS